MTPLSVTSVAFEAAQAARRAVLALELQELPTFRNLPRLTRHEEWSRRVPHQFCRTQETCSSRSAPGAPADDSPPGGGGRHHHQRGTRRSLTTGEPAGPRVNRTRDKGERSMSRITTKDGTQIYFND